MLGQRHENFSLLQECLLHRLVGTFWPGSVGRWPIAPELGLPIQIIDVGIGAGSKKIIPDIANRALHPTFFIPPRNGHRASLEAVMCGERQVLGVEANGTSNAFKHSAFKVVTQDDLWNPTPRLKREHVAQQEAVHARVQTEVQEDASGI